MAGKQRWEETRRRCLNSARELRNISSGMRLFFFFFVECLKIASATKKQKKDNQTCETYSCFFFQKQLFFCVVQFLKHFGPYFWLSAFVFQNWWK
jgi:hypothetical protein